MGALSEMLLEKAAEYELEWNLPPLSVCDFLAALVDDGWSIQLQTVPSEHRNLSQSVSERRPQ